MIRITQEMATIQNDARLFGLDLNGVLADIQVAWQSMCGWAVIAWLKPEPAVRWRRTDGRQVVYRGVGKKPRTTPEALKAARFEAIELPEDLLLRRVVQLPSLPAAALAGALALEVQNLSPFPIDDLLWVSAEAPPPVDGASAATPRVAGRCIAVAIASRAQAQAHIAAVQAVDATAAVSSSAPAVAMPELWVDMGGGKPVIVPGFGEARRAGFQRRWSRINMLLCIVVSLLAFGLLVTPTLQLRLRAIDAVNEYSALQKQVAPLVQQREAYVKAQGLLQALPDAAVQSGAALQIMEIITRALPDDTSLQSFVISAPDGGGKLPKVVLVGQTGNAAALMQQLGNQPGFRDVKAPSAAVKPLGAAKESFNIELLMDLALAMASPTPAATQGAKP